MTWNDLNCRESHLRDDQGRIRGSATTQPGFLYWTCHVRPRPHRSRVYIGARRTRKGAKSMVDKYFERNPA